MLVYDAIDEGDLEGSSLQHLICEEVKAFAGIQQFSFGTLDQGMLLYVCVHTYIHTIYFLYISIYLCYRKSHRPRKKATQPLSYDCNKLLWNGEAHNRMERPIMVLFQP